MLVELANGRAWQTAGTGPQFNCATHFALANAIGLLVVLGRFPRPVLVPQAATDVILCETIFRIILEMF